MKEMQECRLSGRHSCIVFVRNDKNELSQDNCKQKEIITAIEKKRREL